MSQGSGQTQMDKPGLTSKQANDQYKPNFVDGGEGKIPYNTRQVNPYDSAVDSGIIDVYTGILDVGRLSKLRERAVYDNNALSYAPLADAGTGPIFPGAVQEKTVTETALRPRPTSYKGPKQLDVTEENGDVHLNRQFHPNGIENQKLKTGSWHTENKGNLPFVGYPNPDLFYSYMEAIPTHNVQNLSQVQLRDALRTTLDHGDWMSHLGSMLKTERLSDPASIPVDDMVYSDGHGVSSDPRIMQQLSQEYEMDHHRAKRITTAEYDPATDLRWQSTTPGSAYTKEQGDFMREQEEYYGKIAKMSGLGMSYSHPVNFST